jgi:hypothetical protein
VEHVKKADAGDYGCKIMDHNHLASTSDYYVQVHGIHTKYFDLKIVNLLLSDKDASYVDINDSSLENVTLASMEDASVQWLVKYSSHPAATAVWLDPKKKPIAASPKYQIVNRINETFLRIFNITFEDAGNYSLILDNGKTDARRPFRLIIEGIYLFVRFKGSEEICHKIKLGSACNQSVQTRRKETADIFILFYNY